MNNILVYDIETLIAADQVKGGWDNPAGMKLGVACVYDYTKDQYRFFMAGQEEQLEETLKGNTVVSFNGKRFDSCIVQETNKPSFNLWRDVDLFELILYAKHGYHDLEQAFVEKGKWKILDGSLGLDAICVETLGYGKSGKFGALAPAMYKSGQWAELFGYVLQDVRRLRQLFEFIGENKYCIDGKGNRVEIPKII